MTFDGKLIIAWYGKIGMKNMKSHNFQFLLTCNESMGEWLVMCKYMTWLPDEIENGNLRQVGTGRKLCNQGS